jgi:hypothetical protein
VGAIIRTTNIRACLLSLIVSLAIVCGASARPTLDTGDPVGFFTTVANKMLLDTFSYGVTNIPVYSNSVFVYTPSVQRLLQLSANIYEASTTNFYPTIFRPLFEQDNFGNVFIIGYTNLSSGSGFNTVSGAGDPQLALPYDISDLSSFSAYAPIADIHGFVNVYGVPWIIGAKKGFPNFNEFSMQDVVRVTRLLQVTRPTTNSLPTATNQMYLFSITNWLGVEFWNSYTNGYSNQVQVVVNDSLTMQMTLPNGTVPSLPINPNPSIFALSIFTNVSIWPGRSFVLPLNTNVMFVPTSQYDFLNQQFDYVGANPNPSFESIPPPFANLPQILLQVTNRLQAFMLDGTGTRVIDYVSFAGPQSTRNLNSEIFNTNSVVVSLDSQYTNLVWSTATNTFLNSVNPLGIDTQIAISSGAISYDQTYWTSSPQQVGTPQSEIDGFRHFLNPAYATQSQYPPYTTNLAVQVPFAPSISTYEYTSWQANDPLVHYMQSDLYFTGSDPQNGASGIQTGIHRAAVTLATQLPLLPDLGNVNVRYQPWGIKPPTVGTGISQQNYDVNPFNLAFKDPLASNSDSWNFPSGNGIPLNALGQIHRGTPWQTVYLKAHNILTEINPVNPALGYVGTNTWMIWTGDYDANDAIAMAPVQDWHLVSLLADLLNTNDLITLFSVNNLDQNAWQGLLDGLTALTNTIAYPQFSGTQYSTLTVSSNSVQAMTIANAIESIRSSQPAQIFADVGDVFGTLELSEASPFLNTNSIILNGKVIPGSQQQFYGISDEAYEILPSQLLPLLRADSVGSVLLTNNQTIVQFTGYDCHIYVIQTSSDLVNWNNVSTNYPVQGHFSLPIPPVLNSPEQFYRSALLP